MRMLKWLGIIVALILMAFGLGLGLSLGDVWRQADHPAIPGLRHLLGEKIAAQPAAAPAAGVAVPGAPGLPIQDPLSQSTPRAGGSARHTVVVDVAQAVSPAVVSIGVTKTTYVRQYDDFFGLPLSPLGKANQNFPYLGSGFIIDKQGHVLTNYHVVEDSTSINVTLTDKRTYPARLLDADRYVDVALLQIQNLKPEEILPNIPLGHSEDIMIGETVLAVGNPFGPLIADPRPSVSVGVVSAAHRSFKADPQERVYQDMIQTDAAINPGNSGGPLVNLDGEVIGINTFILSRSGDASSVGFSIPISRAARIADEILRFGRIRAIRLDFEVYSLTPYIIQSLGLNVKTGALVYSLDTGGPAQKAGLQPGDVIVRADEKDIEDATDLIGYVLTRTVGESVHLRLLREGKPLDLNYQIKEGRSS